MQVFLYLFLINNLFITSSLIIGSGAVIHALTGRQPEAFATFVSIWPLLVTPEGLPAVRHKDAS